MIKQATLPMAWVFLLGSSTFSDAQVVSQPPANFPGGTAGSFPIAPLVGSVKQVNLLAASQVALVTNNWVNVVSATMSAGNYLVFGECEATNSTTTVITAVGCNINNASSTAAVLPSAGAELLIGATLTTGSTVLVPAGSFAFSASAAATYYMNCIETFGTSTASCYGSMTVIQLP
jgi:hypothetical protein